MPEQQRFCPTCNRAFEGGEAVLRCEGCLVMQHAACWVRRAGCSTPGEHRARPQAIAYPESPNSTATPRIHPGEGTPGRYPEVPQSVPRSQAKPGPSGEAELGGEPAGAEHVPATVIPMRRPAAPGPVMIGAENLRQVRQIPPMTSVRTAAGEGDRKQRPHRAPADRPSGLPRIYTQRHLVRGGQYLAAIAIAVAVAGGVIWAGGKLFGGDGGGQVVVPPLATGATGAAGAGAGTPGAGQSTGAAGTPPAGTRTAGETALAIGSTALVVNTGDCLNVRTAPGTGNPAIVCLKDGSEVTVTGGPQDAEQLRWWKVRTGSGEGWAAGTYLQARR